MVLECLTFLRTAELFFKVAASLYISTSNVQGFQCFHICANTCYGLFDDSCPTGCELLLHCGFICISLIANDVKRLFMHLLYIIFGEMFIQILGSFLKVGPWSNG